MSLNFELALAREELDALRELRFLKFLSQSSYSPSLYMSLVNDCLSRISQIQNASSELRSATEARKLAERKADAARERSKELARNLQQHKDALAKLKSLIDSPSSPPPPQYNLRRRRNVVNYKE